MNMKDQKPPMGLDDTIKAFDCCTAIPPKCGKCPLRVICDNLKQMYIGKQRLKRSVRYWLSKIKQQFEDGRIGNNGNCVG